MAKTQRITYTGPHAGVQLADGQIVERGATVTVDQALALELLEQADAWQAAKPTSTKAKRSAPKPDPTTTVDEPKADDPDHDGDPVDQEG